MDSETQSAKSSVRSRSAARSSFASSSRQAWLRSEPTQPPWPSMATNPVASTDLSRIWALLDAIRLTVRSCAGASVSRDRSSAMGEASASMSSMTESPRSARSRLVSSTPAAARVRSAMS
ncbi:hypothetical protein [Streptomyces malaysiensis]|uniref:hypothetical protein n=1 Tax=Streptomyces malaysiensis TaxID=92644 RepID=UPI001FE8C098|nr:hypothetical protein [Streptomyces solisilvae]